MIYRIGAVWGRLKNTYAQDAILPSCLVYVSYGGGVEVCFGRLKDGLLSLWEKQFSL